MLLSSMGKIVNEEWQATGCLRNNVVLHDYVIMPDHFHAIIEIKPISSNSQPLERDANEVVKEGSLSTIIQQFKGACTRRIREDASMSTLVIWQRGFYDSIIYDKESYKKVSAYIKNNPSNWKGKK